MCGTVVTDAFGMATCTDIGIDDDDVAPVTVGCCEIHVIAAATAAEAGVLAFECVVLCCSAEECG